MSALLAVETSGTLCSLAIRVAEAWFEDTRNVERLHNRLVLEMLDELTATAGVERDGFSAVAFGAGPGSFTGVRIAAAVAQGIALASAAQVYPVPSAMALVHGARHLAGPGTELVTVNRSRRAAYYVATYRVGDSSSAPCETRRERLHQGETAPRDLPPDLPGIGSRPPWWPADRRFLEAPDVTAVTVGELALLDATDGRPPEQALPLYVAGDSPWRPTGAA